MKLEQMVFQVVAQRDAGDWEPRLRQHDEAIEIHVATGPSGLKGVMVRHGMDSLAFQQPIDRNAQLIVGRPTDGQRRLANGLVQSGLLRAAHGADQAQRAA